MKQKLLTIATVLALLVLLALVGENDYEDALLQQQEYCQNVASGIWPDYNGNAKEVCR